MRQDDRTPFLQALQHAREAAYPQGEFVGQESFMRASEIRRLGRRAGVGPGTSVLDLCCGIAGPGRLLTAETGCTYLGLDSSPSAIDIAERLAGDLPCRFEQASVPPLPQGRFDVVLLLETMLAFPDKVSLVAEVARALQPGGRFAFTVEEGRPLTPAERAGMPDSDTVWPIEAAELLALLDDAGLDVTWQEECTAAHSATAAAILRSFRADSERIAQGIGKQAAVELITAHQLWTEWLSGGRVRKFALVAEKR
jgi:SAM-dependent methyltransferase